MPDDNTDYDTRVLEFLRAVEKRPGHCEPMPIDDAAYAKEFPIVEPHERSTCRCGASYDEAHFMALPPPTDAESVWSYPSSGVKFAVRSCTCKNRLARRIA